MLTVNTESKFCSSLDESTLHHCTPDNLFRIGESRHSVILQLINHQLFACFDSYFGFSSPVTVHVLEGPNTGAVQTRSCPNLDL